MSYCNGLFHKRQSQFPCPGAGGGQGSSRGKPLSLSFTNDLQQSVWLCAYAWQDLCAATLSRSSSAFSHFNVPELKAAVPLQRGLGSAPTCLRVVVLTNVPLIENSPWWVLISRRVLEVWVTVNRIVLSSVLGVLQQLSSFFLQPNQLTVAGRKTVNPFYNDFQSFKMCFGSALE